ncbi:hypothetical protein K0M31_009736 [Melipona bicolor]|uniref:Uncharacterized protein n=1 Tax=Melipona bicolor TaxID=60889 RepID=A0AA40FN19_9HYME|nr:hypothetical protein K0M31_009736 [Melipona bicolor]
MNRPACISVRAESRVKHPDPGGRSPIGRVTVGPPSCRLEVVNLKGGGDGVPLNENGKPFSDESRRIYLAGAVLPETCEGSFPAKGGESVGTDSGTFVLRFLKGTKAERVGEKREAKWLLFPDSSGQPASPRGVVRRTGAASHAVFHPRVKLVADLLRESSHAAKILRESSTRDAA